MCPPGNGKPATGAEEHEDSSYHTSHGEDGNITPRNSPPSFPEGDGLHASSSDGTDDTSDPIVVSPANSPPSSPAAQDTDDTESSDLFLDAKVAPEHTSRIPKAPSLLEAGLCRKATPWAIQPWAALVLTLDGRDKITKVLQYASRFLGWWLAGGSHKNQSVRFTTLYKSLAMSRKAFRLGRSFIELEKLRSMGLVGLIFWHLQSSLEEDDDGAEKPKRPKTIVKRASTNIGWGPMTTLDDDQEVSSSRPSLLRSLSSMAYRKMYRPVLSRMSSTLASTETPSVELWMAVGSAAKMVGLLGFWTADNLNFLHSSGALDDYSLPETERLERRRKWQSVVGRRANQTYFAGALAGLAVNWRAYQVFRRNKLAKAKEQFKEAVEESLDDQEQALQQLTKVKEKQFYLFLALLKVRLSRLNLSRHTAMISWG
jgi:hypothetical protein